MKILMYCLLALNVGVWLMYGIDVYKRQDLPDRHGVV